MQKILIIDDRKERKKSLLSSTELKIYDEYCLNGNGLLTEKTSLTNEDNKPVRSKEDILSIFSDFSIIAIHRSYLINIELYNEILDCCKDKYLILFSGGTSTTTLFNNRNGISINSGTFYSSRLLDFIKKCQLDDYTPNLLELLYGDSWRLPLLLTYRNLIWSGRAEDNNYEEKEDEIRLAIDESKHDKLDPKWLQDKIEKETQNLANK